MPMLGIMASSTSGANLVGNYESIATTTLSTATASITFSSIPATYTHLQIRGLVRSDRSGQTQDILGIRLNGDTTNANYAAHWLQGDGSSAAGSNTIGGNPYAWNGYSPAASSTASLYGVMVLDLLDYANTNKNKVTRMLGGNDQNGSGIVHLWSTLWAQTAAVTSVTILPVFGTNLASGTTLALYGIK
jgi:hypothetical protein